MKHAESGATRRRPEAVTSSSGLWNTQQPYEIPPQIWPYESVVVRCSGDDETSNEKRHPTVAAEQEEMFEKLLTPSDVGKLNRLVIPKQYAERYFPMGVDGSAAAEKDVQLSFEDEAGKLWRFRYSYWTSSQSYVLTKGWSRYVKEKRLDAGDVVSFHRRGGGFCIRWRRRCAAAADPLARPPRPVYVSADHDDDLLADPAGATSAGTQPAANAKRLRLFGVNLDCPTAAEEGSAKENKPIGPRFWAQTAAQGPRSS